MKNEKSKSTRQHEYQEMIPEPDDKKVQMDKRQLFELRNTGGNIGL